MNTRSSMIASLLFATCVLSACKSKRGDNQPAPGSAVAAGSAAPAPAPMANLAEGSAATGSAAAPAGSAAAGAAPAGVDPLSVPAVPVPPGKEKQKGPGQTITVSFEDPATSPHKSVTTCPGDKLAIVVPARDSSWTVVKTDPALGKPAEDVVKGWLGPGTDGAKFTWATKEANEFTIVLEEQKTHEKVALELAVFGCD